MKRVLQIVNKMGYGGIETFLMNIYRNIDRENIQFDFAVATSEKGEYDEEIKNMGGNIFYYVPRRKSIKQYKSSIEKILQENEYIAVHMHVSSLTSILPLKLAKKRGIKNRFMHAHNTYQAGFIHNILNKVNQLGTADIITQKFACSTEAGQYVYGRKNEFILIHNGIEAKRFSTDIEKREIIRSQLNLEEQNIAFINVGRFTYQKNHVFLIDIFKEVVKQNTNAILFLVGKGELEEDIKEKVKNENIDKNVKFLGIRSDIPDLLQAMDAFLLPSHHEGLPVVGIEAQAAGLKIFASNTISGDLKITDLVEYLSLEQTAKEWADYILKENLDKKDRYQEIANAGYDTIQIAKTMEKYYNS